MTELVKIVSPLEGVGRLQLNRPEKRNALSYEFIADVIAGIRLLESEGAGVGILEASGTVFCSGIDTSQGLKPTPGKPTGGDLFDAILTSSIFWVSAVQGPAIGAGVAIVAACPMSVVAKDVWFSLPEIGLGLFPSGVIAYLEDRLGVQSCVEWGLSGARYLATDEFIKPLVSFVVEPSQLLAKVNDVAKTLASHAKPTDDARVAWQMRFRTTEFRERKQELDGLLEST